MANSNRFIDKGFNPKTDYVIDWHTFDVNTVIGRTVKKKRVKNKHK